MAIWAQTDFEAGTNGNTVSGSPFQDTSLIVYDNSDPIHGTMSAHAGPKGAGEDWDLQIDVSAKATWRARVYVRLEASVPGPTPAGDYFLMVKEGSQYVCAISNE